MFSFILYFLASPDIVRRIRKEDPDIRLRIFQQPVDLNPAPPALCISASPVCPHNNHTVALLRENILAAIPKNHPLTNSASLTLDDLKGKQFLSLTPSSSLAQTIRYYCEKYGFQPDNTTYVQNPALMRDLLKVNMGITFVPERSWSGLTANAVCFRRITDFPMERYLQLSWDENTYQTPSLQLCRQTISRYFKEYSSQFPEEPEV